MRIRSTYRVAVFVLTTLMLLLGWSIAWAAVEALPPDLIALPWAQIAVGVSISSWGGLTATIGRYLTSVYENKHFHWKLELVKDTAVSITVGFGSYLAGAYQGLSPMALGLVLLLSGYVGVKALRVVGDKFLKHIARMD